MPADPSMPADAAANGAGPAGLAPGPAGDLPPGEAAASGLAAAGSAVNGAGGSDAVANGAADAHIWQSQDDSGLTRQDDLVSGRSVAEPESAAADDYAPGSAGPDFDGPQATAGQYGSSQSYLGQDHRVMDRMSGPADRVGGPADRPARGSLAELRLRLERLPAGHPSSPYDDQSRGKPAPLQLRQLELPLDEERDDPAQASLRAASGERGANGTSAASSTSAANGHGSKNGSGGVPAAGLASAPPLPAAGGADGAAGSPAQAALTADAVSNGHAAGSSHAGGNGSSGSNGSADGNGSDPYRADSANSPGPAAPGPGAEPATRDGKAERTDAFRGDWREGGEPNGNGHGNGGRQRPADQGAPGNGRSRGRRALPAPDEPSASPLPGGQSPPAPSPVMKSPVMQSPVAQPPAPQQPAGPTAPGSMPPGAHQPGTPQPPAGPLSDAPPDSPPPALADAQPHGPADRESPTARAHGSPEQGARHGSGEREPGEPAPAGQAGVAPAASQQGGRRRADIDEQAASGNRAGGGPRAEGAAPSGFPGLTVDQERIADDALARYLAAEGRNVFGGYADSGLMVAMRRVEAQLPHGALAPDSEQHSLKPPERYKQKLARMIARSPGVPAEDLAAEIYDAARFTFVFEPQHYTDSTWMVHRRLKAFGFDLEARRNRWEAPEGKGIRTRWRDQAHDLAFEVQFHIPASWDLLQRGYDAYVRVTSPETSTIERVQLRAAQIAAASSMRPPPRSAEIADFRADVR
jgi:hypothetical protein